MTVTNVTNNYTTKDSGQRIEYPTGMRRDIADDKPDFFLCEPKDVPYGEQILTRFAALMTRGKVKYGSRNWELAETSEELERFISSALRHAKQWANDETDEDHAVAVYFNIMAAEMVKYKMKVAAGE